MSGGGRVVTTTTSGSITRRNYGLNHGYRIDGAKVPGVTTITGHYIVNRSGLHEYPAKQTRLYVANHWDELCALRPGDRDAALYAARYGEMKAAGTRGTDVHRIGARLAAGEADVEYPDELAGHVEAYRDWLDRLDPKILAVELIVGSRQHRYCGTLDLIADLGPIPWAGEIIPPARWLLDVKTSASGIWPETALQLAGYEHAEVFIGEDGDERPIEWLGIERCGAVWVRGDGWDLIPLDTGEEAWQTFVNLAWLFHHEDERKEWIGVAAGPFADSAAITA
jgi:hypothetical protein